MCFRRRRPSRQACFDGRRLPREVQQNIDMESYRIQQTGSGKIALERRPGVLEPVSAKSSYEKWPEELETLSRIIADFCFSKKAAPLRFRGADGAACGPG